MGGASLYGCLAGGRWKCLRFNSRIELRQKRHRRRALAALCALFAAVLMAAAPALTVETGPTAKPAKAPRAPIPLTDVASEAESVTAALRDIQTDLSFDQSARSVARGLPGLTREIDGRLRESRKILGLSPSIEMLGSLEREWLRLRRELAELNGLLTARLRDVERYLG